MNDSPHSQELFHEPPHPPSDWPDQVHSELLVHDGLRWHIQRTGEGPTILLLHGTGGGTHSWARITPALATTHHVVAVDLPGHAFTHVPANVERARNPFTLPGMARLVAGLLRHLGEEPQVAVGHSAGISVLLRMVIDDLIVPRRLVGVCPALVAPPAWYITLVAPIIGAMVETELVAGGAARLAGATGIITRMLESTGSRLTTEQLARYRLLCSRAEHVHAAMTMMARWDLPALHRELYRLRVPLHLLMARHDRWIPLAPLSRAVQGIPGMTMQVEEGGHLLPEEHPDVVVQAIRKAAAAAAAS